MGRQLSKNSEKQLYYICAAKNFYVALINDGSHSSISSAGLVRMQRASANKKLLTSGPGSSKSGPGEIWTLDLSVISRTL